MRYVFAVIMLVNSVVAFFYSTRVFYRKNYKRITYRLFTMLSIASGLWSLGYGVMFFTNRTDVFAVFRAIGATGAVLFMIFGQIVLGIIQESARRFRLLFLTEEVIGAVLLAAYLYPHNYTMTVTPDGISAALNSRLLSLLFALYCVILAVVLLYISLDMARSKNPKRIIAFGKAFILVEGLILGGVVVDTVLPFFGIELHIPACTMLQFWGLEIVYNAIHKINRNQLGMENMTGYIYHSLQSPVLVFDTHHKLKLTNRAADRFFGLASEEQQVTDCFWKELFSMEAPEEILAMGDGKNENAVVYDVVYQKKGVHCRLYLNPIVDEYAECLGYIAVVTDMTEHFNSLKAIEQAKNEAESANVAKSAFLANMSHEIRTPMNSILGFSELGLCDDTQENAKEYFTDIHNSAEILLSTINDILDISKIESGKMELVNAPYYPARVFKDVYLIIGMQAKRKNLQFLMEVAPDYPNRLFGDKTRIREILINLLNNGIKYTKSGMVKLEASVLSKENDIARIRFRISDTGIGIKEEEIEGIFESFKRVDLKNNRKTEGTGLGLSITKGYVDLMGGELRVESVYGSGSTFTVEINQKIEDASPIDTQYNASYRDGEQQLRFKDIRVLAVDDNRVNLKVIVNVMRTYGVEIDTADSGEMAIERCREKEYDVVLMDQMMPGMDGVEAMERIRALNRGYELGGTRKIIVLTANALNGVREEMLEKGFDEYLGKPINRKVLEKQFMKLLPETAYCYVPKEKKE